MPLKKKTLSEWKDIKGKLNELKEKELELRNEICSEILKDKIKGSKSFSKFGFKATATAVMKDSLDKDILKSIFKNLSKEEKACIKYSPSLIAKNYKELPEDAILHQAVVSKPGTPSLTIKELEE